MNLAKKLIDSDVLLDRIEALRGVERVTAMLERIRIIAYIEANESFDRDEED